MRKCKDCQRFYNVSVNAKKVRKHGRNPSLNFTEAEFISWARSQDRACYFCKISEPDLKLAGIKSSIGLNVAALGIDRLDNSRDYDIDNIALCCYACNKAKGNVFSSEEMIVIGRSIGVVWASRGISVSDNDARAA